MIRRRVGRDKCVVWAGSVCLCSGSCCSFALAGCMQSCINTYLNFYPVACPAMHPTHENTLDGTSFFEAGSLTSVSCSNYGLSRSAKHSPPRWEWVGPKGASGGVINIVVKKSGFFNCLTHTHTHKKNTNIFKQTLVISNAPNVADSIPVLDSLNS